MSNIRFRGVIPALVTPLNEDGSVKEGAVAPLVETLLAAGCSGFYICGGTGEGTVMQPQARVRMAELTVQAVAGRGYVINHVGAVDLITARKLAAHSSSIGVDAISSVPPFFYRYGDQDIYNYYKALSDASDVPLVMYASPLSGVPVTCEMVDKLMEIPRMIGLKWTNPNYYEMHKITQLRDRDINVINGPDETFICGLSMGAQAGIGTTYNVMPKVFIDIYNAFLANDWAAARAAQAKADVLIRLLQEFNALTAVKAILSKYCCDMGYCTYPLPRLDAAGETLLWQRLDALDFEKSYWKA